MILTALVLTGMSSRALWGQASELETRVTAPSGLVAYASVVAIQRDTGIETWTSTNEQGTTLLRLPVGTYDVYVDPKGFEAVRILGVELHLSIRTVLNVRLKDPPQEEVEAKNAQLLINIRNAELVTLVDKQQVLDLPLDGRNPLQLSALQAGVATNSTLTRAVIHGLRGTFNNITQDGINIQDPSLREAGFFGVTAPSVENVLEFSIVTQNSGAESGFGVSQIRLVTPSGRGRGPGLVKLPGLSSWHGNVFDFHRNTALNANSFFNNASGLDREALIRHQFGGSAGGTIGEDERLFLFGYYEGTRENQESSLLRTVLTPTAREGIFAYPNQNVSGEPCDFAGFGTRTGTATDGRICSVGLATFSPRPTDELVNRLLPLVPGPNASGVGDGLNTAGFRFNSPRPRDVDLLGVRADWVFERGLVGDNRLEVSYSRAGEARPRDFQNVGSAPDIGEPYPGRPGGGRSSVRRLGTAAWHYLRPAFSNELRWGLQHADFRSFTRETFARGQFGLGDTFPEQLQFELPLIDHPVRNFLPQGRRTRLQEVSNHSIWTRGRHTLHFGGHFRLIRAQFRDSAGVLPLLTLGFGRNNPSPLAPGAALFPGEISLEDRQRAESLLALLTGARSAAFQTFNTNALDRDALSAVPRERNFGQRFLSFYGGDTFRARRNLTLSAGLRWELHGAPEELDGLSLLPEGGLEALLDPQARIGRVGRGTGRSFYETDLDNFAPSLGVAWDPIGDGRTSLRAGYAVSFAIDNTLSSVLNAADSNPGLTLRRDVSDLAGTVTQDGVPVIESPELALPRTLEQQLAESTLNGLFTIDPELRTPYVQQWTLGLSRQFGPVAVEARYVGNHAVKLARAVDVNQPDLRQNEFLGRFLEDFLRAASNLDLTGDPFVGQSLQIFPLLAGGGRNLLGDPTVQSLLRTGEIGELLFFMFQNPDLAFSAEGPCGFTTSPEAGLSRACFYPNPNALFASFLGSGSFSTYHAVQLEVRQRLSRGLNFQANYTFGKVLTDFSGTVDNAAPFLDPARSNLEVRRANFDVRHLFNANFLWAVPPGLGIDRWTRRGWGGLLDDWHLNGIVRLQSGPPVSIVSGRGTYARRENAFNNTVDLGVLPQSELAPLTGIFRLADGSVSLFSPLLLDAAGGASSQVFRNPEAGEVGSLGLTPVTGPGFFNVDLGLVKDIQLTETLGLEFRAEFFNLFNNTNWRLSANRFGDVVQNVNDPNFGRIVDTFSPRILQFGLKVNF